MRRSAGVLSQITAAHLPYWDGSVKCMQSMLFVKPPGFQGQAWHQDEIYIPTRDRSLIGAWIAIDDATIENGCLWIVPGSHRSGYLYPQRDHNNPDEFDFAGQSYGFDEKEEIPVEVPAGSVVFFNGYLLHRSAKNRSSIYRRVLVSHYMNAYSLLPWHVKQGEPAAMADRRTIVPVSGVDPYAWKGFGALAEERVAADVQGERSDDRSEGGSSGAEGGDTEGAGGGLTTEAQRHREGTEKRRACSHRCTQIHTDEPRERRVASLLRSSFDTKALRLEGTKKRLTTEQPCSKSSTICDPGSTPKCTVPPLWTAFGRRLSSTSGRGRNPDLAFGGRSESS